MDEFIFGWTSMVGAAPPASPDRITEVIRQLADDQALFFGVRDVRRGYNSWDITLQAIKGKLVIRTAKASVRVPAGKAEQEVYDGLKPYMEQIIGRFIDMVLGELRDGEGEAARNMRNAIVLVSAAQAPELIARPKRRIEELS